MAMDYTAAVYEPIGLALVIVTVLLLMRSKSAVRPPLRRIPSGSRATLWPRFGHIEAGGTMRRIIIVVLTVALLTTIERGV